MTTWTRSARALSALALVAGGLVFTPTLKASAALCISEPANNAVNPITTQVSGDFAAAIDNTRPYSDITSPTVNICSNRDAASITTTNEKGVAGVIHEASFTFQVAGAIPTTFPTAAGDVGVSLTACVDVSGALGSSAVQIGVGHRGGPIFDGPYPATQGYKYCTWWSRQLGLADDWGTAVFTPEGIFNQTSHLNLHDTGCVVPNCATAVAPVTTITAPSVSGSTATLYLPDTEVYQVNAVAPPLKGLPHTFTEPFLGPLGSASPINNIVLEAQVQAEVSLPSPPAPLCVNPTDLLATPTNPAALLVCDGKETVGPVQGIVGLLVTTSWAPGLITCPGFPNPLTCAASDGGNTGITNGQDLGILEVPPGVPGVGLVGQAIATCANPLKPGPPTPPANNPLVTCTELNGTYTYNPCQTTSTPEGQDQADLTLATGSCPVAVPTVSLPYQYDSEYGRIYAWTLGVVPGTAFYLAPTFLPDGWNN